VPSASNIRRYAEIVRERSILRKLVSASDEIATQAFNPKGKAVDKILDEAEQKIFNIGEEGSRMKQGFQGMDSLVVQLLDRVQEMADNPNDITGVPTGFYDLDRHDLGHAGGRSDCAGRAPVHGQDGPGHQHCRACGPERRLAGGRVLHGDGGVAVGGAYRGLHRPH
jgi:replicative DNA helicase